MFLAPFAGDNKPCLAPKGKVIVRAFTAGDDAPCIHRVPNPGVWCAAGLVDALRSGTKSSHGKRRQRKREDICKRLSDCQYALPSRLNCRRFLTVPEQLTNRLGSMPAGRQQRSVVLNLRFRWPGDTACLGQKVDVLRGGALMLRDCEEDQTCAKQRKRIDNFLRSLSSSMRLEKMDRTRLPQADYSALLRKGRPRGTAALKTALTRAAHRTCPPMCESASRCFHARCRLANTAALRR